MKGSHKIDDKQLYQQCRRMPWSRLWKEEVKRFNSAAASDRTGMASVIRAVGVVFAESGNQEQTEEVKLWLLERKHQVRSGLTERSPSLLGCESCCADAEGWRAWFATRSRPHPKHTASFAWSTSVADGSLSHLRRLLRSVNFMRSDVLTLLD